MRFYLLQDLSPGVIFVSVVQAAQVTIYAVDSVLRFRYGFGFVEAPHGHNEIFYSSVAGIYALLLYDTAGKFYAFGVMLDIKFSRAEL